VAVGPGDAMQMFHCECGTSCFRTLLAAATRGFPRCEKCGESMQIVVAVKPPARAPMHVSVGDEILYDRSPANDVSINGEEHCFLHEEQHVLAVLEHQSIPKEIAA
jgi:hypothetical protein